MSDDTTSLEVKQITQYLPDPKQLEALKQGLASGLEAVPPQKGQLSLLPETIYPASTEYLDLITKTFFDPANPPSAATLTSQNRERCLVALLCSRREDLELAIHIYLALIGDISVSEIANIMLLAGMYTGIDNFNRGLVVEALTLQTLARLLKEKPAPTLKQVVGELMTTFGRGQVAPKQTPAGTSASPTQPAS